MIPDNISDAEKAAVVKTLRKRGYGDAHEKLFVELSVTFMQYFEDVDVDPDDLDEDEVEQILDSVDVHDALG